MIRLAAILAIPALAAAQPSYTRVLPQPDAATWQPISQGERFRQYTKSTFNPLRLGTSAVSAAIQFGRERPEEWGLDWGGYGQRYGNYLAKSTLRSTLRYGVAAALNEDTRYISSGRTSTKARIWYAISTTYSAFDGNGHRRFAVSKFVANAGTSALSRTWAPPSWQGGRQIATDFAIGSLTQAGWNVAREFMPDLIRKLKR